MLVGCQGDGRVLMVRTVSRLACPSCDQGEDPRMGRLPLPLSWVRTLLGHVPLPLPPVYTTNAANLIGMKSAADGSLGTSRCFGTLSHPGSSRPHHGHTSCCARGCPASPSGSDLPSPIGKIHAAPGRPGGYRGNEEVAAEGQGVNCTVFPTPKRHEKP